MVMKRWSSKERGRESEADSDLYKNFWPQQTSSVALARRTVRKKDDNQEPPASARKNTAASTTSRLAGKIRYLQRPKIK